jgi:hypothetical protein
MHINGQQLTKNLQESRNLATKHGNQMLNANGRMQGFEEIRCPFAYYSQVALM